MVALSQVEAAELLQSQRVPNWNAAKSDKAKSFFPTTYLLPSLASKFDGSPVPVILPVSFLPGISTQGFTSSRDIEVQFDATPDGYFASATLPKYKISVDASLLTLETNTGQQLPSEVPAVFSRDYGGGATVALTKYNVAYLIQFTCNSGEVTKTGCISKAEALAEAEVLIPVGGQQMK